MNKVERMKMVKAMEYIARQVNDEELFCSVWLTDGVADGDIRYGDLEIGIHDTDDEAEWYIEDDNFKDLMGTFLFLMKNACKSGGLYCDGIVDSYSK